jgi:S-(hydroxymethyl)glutathione dehydrogenase/alcohol dehydrogenase
MKSRAAIFEGVGKPLIVDEIEIDPPKQGEVLVRLRATGLCHTEIWYMSGGDTRTLVPAILGHEGGGVVEQVGPGVKSLKEGDHVIPLYISECGDCPECRSETTNLCSALDATYYDGLMPDGTTRLHWRGQDVKHFMGTSTFAEYTVVPEVALAKVRPDAPLEKVCLFGCAITTGVGAALYTAKVKPGSTCAIFGCGPIGLNVVQGCRLAGAEKVIAVDLKDKRLEMAKFLGATHLVNASDGQGVQSVKDLTGGGADYTFEATGLPAVMRQAFEACHYGGGQCTLIGVARTGEDMCVTPRMLIAGRILTGTAFGGCRGRTQIPGLIDRYMAGDIKVDEFVTETIKLEQINDAFERMKRDEGYRYIVDYRA